MITGAAGTPWQLRPSFAVMAAVVYFSFAWTVLSNGSFALFGPEKLGLVFNDMARRMLSWDFSSSPDAIQYEAFVREGRTYAYYGIFPALLRLPLIAAGFDDLTVGIPSSLIALTITVFAYVRIYQVALFRQTGRLTMQGWAAILSVAFTGPQVFLLASASLYHEIIFWSAALTAMYILIIVRCWAKDEEIRDRDLFLLASLAGTCLLCRIPDGVSLYVTLLLLLTRVTWRTAMASEPGRRLIVLMLFPLRLRRVVLIGLFSLVFVAIQGFINYQRWGNILTTSPYSLYIQYQTDPDALARIGRHGLFSWVRVGLASLYYSTGLKLEAVAPVLFGDYYGTVEGPRALVILTSPVLFWLAVGGLLSLFRRPFAVVMPLFMVIGSLTGIGLVLGFLALCLRYTFDAWGLVVVLSAIGLRGAQTTRVLPRFVGLGSIILFAGGVVVSQATLLRYKIVYSGTDPAVRFSLSKQLQPLVCPKATVRSTIKLSDFNPLITQNCPPLW